MEAKNMNEREAALNSFSHECVIFLFICVFRIINALIIRTQFDPDEYWQTLEPAYCLAFHEDGKYNSNQSLYGCAYTWEWKRRYRGDSSTMIEGTDSYIETIINPILWGPVRSSVSTLPTAFLYWMAHYFHIDSNFVISKGPILLHSVLVAAVTDMAVYKIAKELYDDNEIKNNEKKNISSCGYWALFCSLTSWFHGYALVRTYSNSMECMLILVGMTLLMKELFHRDRGQIKNRTLSDDTLLHTSKKTAFAFFLGGICISIRFTAIAAWIPFGLILCKNKYDEAYQKFRAHPMPLSPTLGYYGVFLYHLFYTCAFFGLMGVLFSSILDCYFYGFWTVPFIGNFHFNVILGLGSLYGTHPWYWYICSGVPAITGIMLPLFLYYILWYINDLSSCIYKSTKSTSFIEEADQSSTRILVTIIVVYIILHSISAHKEFRFILPVLPFICILSGRTLSELLAHSSQQEITTTHQHPHANYDINQKSKITAMKVKNWWIQLSKRRRTWIVIVLFILLNFPHLLFLCLVHQTGPISINKAIVKRMTQEKAKLDNPRSSTTTPPQTRRTSVHYLMGCHSAPVYSHLHIPSIIFDVWTLDCSPHCRSNDNVEECESELFSQDPQSFIQKTYYSLLSSPPSSCPEYPSSLSSCNINEDHERNNKRDLPRFMVISESDSIQSKLLNVPILSSSSPDISDDISLKMIPQMKLISRVPHTISGIRFLFGRDDVGNNYRSNDSKDVGVFDSIFGILSWKRIVQLEYENFLLLENQSWNSEI